MGLNGIYVTPELATDIYRFIRECEAKRKEILDAKLDTDEDTNIPTLEDIIEDLFLQGFDTDGDSYNRWGVTDNYDSDTCISCHLIQSQNVGGETLYLLGSTK